MIESDFNESVLLDYQKQWVLNAPKYPLALWDKSRRIGASWSDAPISVMDATRQKHPVNSYYISANKEMAETYIKDATHFTKVFNQGTNILLGQDLIEEDNILIYRLRFKTGKDIFALSSAPRNLRGKQGNVIIDEAAFHDDLDALLKAAVALMIWGCQVRILSTHFGIDNPFNKLLKKVKVNSNNYYQKTTFKEAIQQQLYRRICLIQGIPYSLENEFEFVKQIYEEYGDDAAEELDCIPSIAETRKIFKTSYINVIQELPKEFDVLIRAWDTAATLTNTSCFTVGILLGKIDDDIYILEWDYTRANPQESQSFIIDTAKEDGNHISLFVELEGGSQSRLWLENTLKSELDDYSVQGISPQGSKLVRALPVARKVKQGKFYILDSPWKQDFFNTLDQYAGQKKSVPLVSDTVDSLSLGYHCLKKFNSMFSLF